jgi:hypothetical protein
MTLIKYSGLVSDHRGVLNGSIFSKNKSGNIVKNKQSPLNRSSFSQQTYRANWAYIVKYWKFLTVEQRDSWINLAASTTWHNSIGNAYHPSGQQLYLYCNQNLYSVNLPMLLLAVNPIGRTIITSAYVTQGLWNYYSMSLEFYPTPVNSHVRYKLYATPSLSPGISYARKQLRLINIIVPGTASPYDFTTPYVDLYDLPVAGSKVFFKLVPVDIVTGFDTVPLYFNIIVGTVFQPIFHPALFFGFTF